MRLTLRRRRPVDTARRFVIHSLTTGHVVGDGVAWPDGPADVRWRGPRRFTTHWDHLADAVAVYDGRAGTRIHWIDPRPDNPTETNR